MVACSICTFINNVDANICSMCDNPIRSQLTSAADNYDSDEEYKRLAINADYSLGLLCQEVKENGTCKFSCAIDDKRFSTLALMRAHLIKDHAAEINQLFASQTSTVDEKEKKSEEIDTDKSDYELCLQIALEDFEKSNPTLPQSTTRRVDSTKELSAAQSYRTVANPKLQVNYSTESSSHRGKNHAGIGNRGKRVKFASTNILNGYRPRALASSLPDRIENSDDEEDEDNPENNEENIRVKEERLRRLVAKTDKIVANLSGLLGSIAYPVVVEGQLDKEDEKKVTVEQLSARRQPVALSGCELRDYQLGGVEWLCGLHHSRLNGILADEMGLGNNEFLIPVLDDWHG